jgi:hypothetical protein
LFVSICKDEQDNIYFTIPNRAIGNAQQPEDELTTSQKPGKGSMITAAFERLSLRRCGGNSVRDLGDN